MARAVPKVVPAARVEEILIDQVDGDAVLKLTVRVRGAEPVDIAARSDAVGRVLSQARNVVATDPAVAAALDAELARRQATRSLVTAEREFAKLNNEFVQRRVPGRVDSYDQREARLVKEQLEQMAKRIPILREEHTTAVRKAGSVQPAVVNALGKILTDERARIGVELSVLTDQTVLAQVERLVHLVAGGAELSCVPARDLLVRLADRIGQEQANPPAATI